MNFKKQRKKLLIGVTYGNVAAKHWLETQLKFIKKYTTSFDFAVYLHEVEDKSLFKKHIVIGSMDGPLLKTLSVMFKNILEFFRANKNYDNYLLLDSDCFPVTENWLPKLISIMDDKWYAAPIRTENLDYFPHPCGLFIKGDYINEDIFDFTRFVKVLPNFIGKDVGDIGTAIERVNNGKHILFPLLRTNFFNPHPVMSAIYGNIFYHHGAGSRHPFYRSTPYYNKMCPEYYKTYSQCHNAFKQDPEGYISRLKGDGFLKNINKFIEV
jgi:hypothetical protein